MTPATRAAALILAITGTAPMFPVAVLRENSGGAWLYLYSGLDLVALCGPCSRQTSDRYPVVRVDLRGCEGAVEALGRVERETAGSAELVLL